VNPQLTPHQDLSSCVTELSRIKSKSKSKSHCDWRSVTQSVVDRAHDQIIITLWQLRSCFLGAPSLTRGRVCLLYMLLALTTAYSFSGPSPSGLVTIFYCLWRETSLFVASYDSQGHGGGIRPHLHTGDTVTITRVALYSLRAHRTENPDPLVVSVDRTENISYGSYCCVRNITLRTSHVTPTE
jgi:hypothetical protein